jgi:hypothetical protein
LNLGSRSRLEGRNGDMVVSRVGVWLGRELEREGRVGRMIGRRRERGGEGKVDGGDGRRRVVKGLCLLGVVGGSLDVGLWEGREDA